MAEKNFLEEEPQTEEEYEIAFAQILAEMKKIRLEMDSDQEAVEKAKAEKAAYEAEMAVLKAETRAILARLKAMFPDNNDTSSANFVH